jgi:hypothetical protein
MKIQSEGRQFFSLMFHLAEREGLDARFFLFACFLEKSRRRRGYGDTWRTTRRDTFAARSDRRSRVAKKLKLQERRAVIPSRRSLAACRPLHFFGAINGALCGSADKWGGTHGVGTYPGLHYGDGGP